MQSSKTNRVSVFSFEFDFCSPHRVTEKQIKHNGIDIGRLNKAAPISNLSMYIIYFSVHLSPVSGTQKGKQVANQHNYDHNNSRQNHGTHGIH